MIYKLQDGRKINYSAIDSTNTQNLEYVDKELEKAGYNYIQRLAILGTIKRESSGDPLAVSSNGLGHGLIQGDKDRYRIKNNNKGDELKRQTQLLIKELEKTGWSGKTGKDQLNYSNSFKNANNLEQAVDLFTRHFVRPSNTESEIQKRLDFAKQGGMDIEDSEYDLETAKRVLPIQVVEKGRKNPEENHLPTGYTDDEGKYHYLKSSMHESYPESVDYEHTDSTTRKAMSKYKKPDNYVSKFPTLTPIKMQQPKYVTPLEESLVYVPLILKHQDGGLVYKPFIYNKEKKEKEHKQESLFDFLNSSSDKYPVEKVQIYKPTVKEEEKVETPQIEPTVYSPTTTTTTPDAVTVQPISTTSFHEGTVQTPITKGTIKYRKSGMKLGNLQEFANLLAEEGISFTVTSGVRDNAVTKSGHRSRHADGNAMDIVPADGDFVKFKQQINNSQRIKDYMKTHKVRILDESHQSVLNVTGGTGKHAHVSYGGERFGSNLGDNVGAFDDDGYAYTNKPKQ